jgi:hypothetical protein
MMGATVRTLAVAERGTRAEGNVIQLPEGREADGYN